MPSDDAIRTAAKAQGLRIKRNNLIAAFLSGLALVCISIKCFPHSTISTRGFLFGLGAGLLYANGFEYFLHRFLLHSGHGIFSQQHMVHHTTLQSPDAARYINFSSNPWGVVGLFCANAVPFLVFQRIFHMAGLSEYLRASRSITSLLRRFTGARTWADGCRSGSGRRRGTTCCTTRSTDGSMYSCPFLIGWSTSHPNAPNARNSASGELIDRARGRTYRWQDKARDGARK